MDGVSTTEEKRSYCVIRDDLPLTRTSYLALAALGYCNASLLCAARPDLLSGYDPLMQPKLALRAKNAALMTKAEDALHAGGIPFVGIQRDGETVGLFLAPSLRSSLPKEVAGLQLFAERRNPVDDEEEAVLIGDGNPDVEPNEDICVIAFRDELEAPLGKMMAQVGHAAWGAGASGQERLVVLGLDDRTVRAAQALSGWSSIVDAGRTVFGEPTMTCIWGGSMPFPVTAYPLDIGVSTSLPSDGPGIR